MNSARDRVRVLLIAPAPEAVGGQAVQAKRLRAALGKDADVVVTFQPIGPDPPRLLRFVKHVRGARTVVALIQYVATLLGGVRRTDVVHIFSAAYTSYMLWTLPALVVARAYSKPIVLNYRDGQADDHLRNWRTAIPTIRKMDAVVAPSEYLVDVFANHGLSAQSISNILDPTLFHYRPRYHVKPIFLHNRTLEALYNVPCTLRAFQLIQRQYPDASLVIAHEGPLRGALEALAKQLGLRNTRFVGVVPNDRIAELYDAADIYLMSPNFDNMPGSLLECFAAGLPVVTTGVGGIPYIAKNEDTALLVPKGDHEAMAQAAIRLLTDPDLVDRVTRKAYASCSRYAEGPVRKQWVELYKRLAGTRAGHNPDSDAEAR